VRRLVLDWVLVFYWVLWCLLWRVLFLRVLLVVVVMMVVLVVLVVGVEVCPIHKRRTEFYRPIILFHVSSWDPADVAVVAAVVV